MNANTQIRKIEMATWATPAEGCTIDEMLEELRFLNNPILTVDRVNNRVLIGYEKEEFPSPRS